MLKEGDKVKVISETLGVQGWTFGLCGYVAEVYFDWGAWIVKVYIPTGEQYPAECWFDEYELALVPMEEASR